MTDSPIRLRDHPARSPDPDGAARLLLVDDRPDNLVALETALEGLGATIVRAYSGDEALKHLLVEEFAAAVLDVRMPGTDGFETARLIRARPATRHLPIIFLTATEAGSEEVSRAYALGAVDFLSKPVLPDVLRAKVAVFVDLYRKGRDARKFRARYDSLSELAPVGVFHTDAQGDCLWVNPRWCEIAGLTPEQARGKGWSSAIHPDDRERVFQDWYRAAGQNAVFRSEYRFRRPDGSVTWVLGQAKAEKDPSQKVVGYVGTVTDISERKQAEADLGRRVDERTEALREANARLRSVLEGALDAVVTIDDRGLIVDWNAQAERTFGWARGEVEGRAMVELLVPPAYREGHRRGFEQCLKTGEGRLLGRRLELPALRKGGTEFPAELTVLHVRAGGKVYFTAFLRDVSDRKKAEEASALLAAVVRSSDDAILTKSLDGTVTSWNEAAERIYGYPSAEILGRPITMIVPESLHEEERRILERIRRGERVEHYETVRRRKDGALIDVSLTISPIRDSEGRVVGASKISRDVTERKRAIDEIRKWEHIFSHAGWAVAVSDAATDTLTAVNEAFARMHGYSAGELVGKPIRVTFAPSSRENLPEFIRETHERGDLLYESTHRRKDGSEFPVLTQVTAFRDERGKVLFRAATFQDLTETKRAEEEIRKLNQQLERRVEERTGQLQDALTNVEAFSYSVAHDLKAPVRAMKSYSQLMLEEFGDGLDERARKYLDRIARSAEQMDVLIRDLLAYSRVSQEDLELRRVELAEVWKGVQEEFAGEIGERRASVRVDGALPPVTANSVALAQVFTNLLSNALKFVRPGVAPRVCVRADRRDGRVRVWVEDNGIGIEPRHRAKLFRVFERLHDDSVYPGTGIGLAIVRKAVERMKGEVGFESRPGDGTRFWVELPAAP